MEVRGHNGGAMEKNSTCKQSSRSNLALQLELHLANFFSDFIKFYVSYLEFIISKGKKVVTIKKQ